MGKKFSLFGLLMSLPWFIGLVKELYRWVPNINQNPLARENAYYILMVYVPIMLVLYVFGWWVENRQGWLRILGIVFGSIVLAGSIGWIYLLHFVKWSFPF